MMLTYITCSGSKEARRIAEHLIRERLAACVNMFPIESMYRWKGKLCRSREVALIAKTEPAKFAGIKKEVKKMHSYDTPCILKIRAEANNEFSSWVKKEVM